ncbi:MAG: hypothetical protein IJR53_00560 [Bacteroidales bacterium]|nr:hypothetical protein [Bacteroidales bacterium]
MESLTGFGDGVHSLLSRVSGVTPLPQSDALGCKLASLQPAGTLAICSISRNCETQLPTLTSPIH